MRYFFLVLSLALIGCKQEDKSRLTIQELYGSAIGTTYSIKAFHYEPLEIQREVDSLINMFNKSMSTWVPNSLINQFNDGKDSVLVGLPFKLVHDQAKIIFKKTDGYFDPSVGNLVNAYGFGAEGSKTQPPSPKKLDSLKEFVGYKNIKLAASKHPDSFYLTTDKKGIYIEYNAIGKGTLVDYIGNMLSRKGVENFLVEVGGEVVARGRNIDRDKPWAVGIDDPKQEPGKRTYISIVNLKDRAMAGSGNYRKFKKDPETGKEYVHTVNPLTGEAQPSRILGVNVIAPTCTQADGYATAFMAMPLEKSLKLMNELPGIDVLIMHLDDNDILRFEMTDGFKEAVKKQQ
jgi:thiamine biosynthesis lipoprotein